MYTIDIYYKHESENNWKIFHHASDNRVDAWGFITRVRQRAMIKNMALGFDIRQNGERVCWLGYDVCGNRTA